MTIVGSELILWVSLMIIQQAASCEHIQAIGIMSCETKELQNPFVFFFNKESVLTNMQLQHTRKWPPTAGVFLFTCCCKNKKEIGFLFLTSAWGYQNGFSVESS